MPRSGGSCPVGCGADTAPATNRGVIAAAVLLLMALVLAPTGAGAESPTALATDELADDGVYVAPGRGDLDEEALVESVNTARARGLRLVVVAPTDPQPSAAAFARRVQEAADADAAIVFPTEGGLEAHVIDEFESASLRAVDTARSQANPALAVDAFSSELLVEPTQSLPPIVRQVVLLVLLLAFLLAGVVALEQVRRRATRQEARVGRGGQPAPAVHPVTTDWRHPGSTGR